MDPIGLIFNLFYIVLFIRIIMSWVSPYPRNEFVRQVRAISFMLTEPLLAPIRNVLPAAGGLDFSPLILILLLGVVERLIRGIL